MVRYVDDGLVIRYTRRELLQKVQQRQADGRVLTAQEKKEEERAWALLHTPYPKRKKEDSRTKGSLLVLMSPFVFALLVVVWEALRLISEEFVGALFDVIITLASALCVMVFVGLVVVTVMEMGPSMLTFLEALLSTLKKPREAEEEKKRKKREKKINKKRRQVGTRVISRRRMRGRRRIL